MRILPDEVGAETFLTSLAKEASNSFALLIRMQTMEGI